MCSAVCTTIRSGSAPGQDRDQRAEVGSYMEVIVDKWDSESVEALLFLVFLRL